MSVSVIIPTYNRAYIIKESIQSVLNQSLEPLEIIIVDDHSSDNTKEVIHSMKNDKIKYVLNSRTKGANGARNTGIMLAQGDYIAFQDSDDLWVKDKLENQMNEMLRNPDAAMCFCSLELINGDSSEYKPNCKINSEDIYRKLLTGNFISTQAIVIKTNLAKKYLFDESLSRFQDWDFCLRIAKEKKVIHVEKPLVKVTLQNDSISRVVNEEKSIYDLFNKHSVMKDINYANKSIYNKALFVVNKKNLKSLTYIFNYVAFKLLHISGMKKNN